MLIALIGTPYSGVRTAASWLKENGVPVIPNAVANRHGECNLEGSGRGPSVIIVKNVEEALSISRLPNVSFVAIDAPVVMRWRRSQESGGTEAKSLREFVQYCDDFLYSAGKQDSGSAAVRMTDFVDSSKIILTNNSSKEDFYRALESSGICKMTQGRPTWDNYFLRLAILTAKRTNCMKRGVGAVIVKNNRVVSTGYNGTPSGATNCNEGGCKRCNNFVPMGEGLELCLCLHAEENAIIEAGANRCAGATIYSSLFPCLSCTKQIIQAGITEVVYSQSYVTDTEAIRMMGSMGITVRETSTAPYLS